MFTCAYPYLVVEHSVDQHGVRLLARPAPASHDVFVQGLGKHRVVRRQVELPEEMLSELLGDGVPADEYRRRMGELYWRLFCTPEPVEARRVDITLAPAPARRPKRRQARGCRPRQRAPDPDEVGPRPRPGPAPVPVSATTDGALEKAIVELLGKVLDERLQPIARRLEALEASFEAGAYPEAGAEYLTIREAAELLKVAPQTLRRWISRGDLRAEGSSRARRVQREEVLRFMAAGGPATAGSSSEPVDPAELARRHFRERNKTGR